MSGFLASVDPRRVQWGAAWYAMHSRILRTKPVESMLEGTGTTTAHGTKLAQVLTTVDLISLGVGSCVGTGMYVVSGLVAKEMAGPGVIVSFIIAAVASILSGECLGGRVACRPACCSFHSCRESIATFVYLRAGGGTCQSLCVVARRQRVGVGSPLPPDRSWGLNPC